MQRHFIILPFTIAFKIREIVFYDITEAALHIWKFEANLQENNNAKV